MDQRRHHGCHPQSQKVLIREFGANVNIANVMPDDVMETEVLRAGLSVIHVGNAGHAAQPA